MYVPLISFQQQSVNASFILVNVCLFFLTFKIRHW